MLNPPLKWAGSKSRNQIPDLIRKFFEPYRHSHTYVEPFCGGLGSLLRVSPESAILNDSNDVLIGFYEWLQDDSQVLDEDYLELEFTKDVYYSIREDFNSHLLKTRLKNWLIDEDHRKHLFSCFYWLNKSCFNGLYRENSDGFFNVPIGRYKSRKLLKTFEDYFWEFDKYQFHNGSYTDLEIPENAWIYCDPPYDAGFTKYSSKDFSWKDQVALGEWLVDQNKPCCISNKVTDRIVELYSQLAFDYQVLAVRRSISANGDRDKALEIFAWKKYRTLTLTL